MHHATSHTIVMHRDAASTCYAACNAMSMQHHTWYEHSLVLMEIVPDVHGTISKPVMRAPLSIEAVSPQYLS